MVQDRNSDVSRVSNTWALIVLAIGAIIGMAVAANLLARKDRAQPEDPDAPLFI